MIEAEEKDGEGNSPVGPGGKGKRKSQGAGPERERLLAVTETIFAALPEPLFTCDLQGRIVCVNPAMRAACGFDPVNADHAELLRKLGVHYSDGRPMKVEEFPSARAARGERICEEQIAFRPAGSGERTALCSAFPLETNGEIFGTVMLWRDVTDRDELLDEMARHMAELDAIINAIADAVVIYGSGGEILRMNPAASQILGYAPEEVVRPMEERIAALRLKTVEGEPFPVEEIMRRIFYQGETVKGMILSLDRPAGKLWVSASAAPIVTADGRRIGAVGTAVDISRLRELQEEREIYLHTISHDLRSPLTIIQGHAQLLESALTGGGRDGLRESIEAILQAARGMADMIDTLVDTAFLESGQMRLKTESLHLQDFIEDYLRRTEIALDRERISVDLPPELPGVMADPLRLERILSNLLTNALKYSPPESPVRLEVRSEGTRVCISVVDRGPGIAGEDLPHIFERFYRTKGERKGKGIGLGLYITRLLAEAHGGGIWVKSTPGEGSVFSFSLPIASCL